MLRSPDVTRGADAISVRSTRRLETAASRERLFGEASRATCHGYMIADRTSTDQASAVEMRAPLYLAYGLTLHAALQACRRSPVVAGRSPSSFESLPGDCLTV